MNTRFKPLLAAAFAAGLIPMFTGEKAEGGTITAAGFTFESLSATSTGISSLSMAADTFSPGYSGTLVAAKTATDGYFEATTGNGSATAVKMQDTVGASYNFSFPIDNLASLQMAFDMTINTFSPTDFVVECSLDGVNYTPVSTISASNWGWQGTRVTVTAASYLINLPSSFSDVNTDVSGNTGYLLLTQIGTDLSTGFTFFGASNILTSTATIDNVYITGSAVPEPATVGIIGMAGLGLLGRRRR